MVYSMMFPYFNCNSVVYIDNLYTTHELHLRLRAKNTVCIGTVRKNNLPKALKPLFAKFIKLKRHPPTTSVNGVPIIELVSQCWVVDNVYYYFIKDNGDFVISCNDTATVSKGLYKSPSKLNDKQRIKFKTESYEAFKIVPFIVHQYNQHMNGVDVIDQLISSFERHQRNKKWYHTYLFTSIRLGEVSAYKINSIFKKELGLNVLDHCAFKQEIALALLSTVTDVGHLETPPTAAEQIKDHVLSVHVKKQHGGKKKKCRWAGCKRSTTTSCLSCMYSKGGALYLCGEHYKEHIEIECGNLNV